MKVMSTFIRSSTISLTDKWICPDGWTSEKGAEGISVVPDDLQPPVRGVSGAAVLGVELPPPVLDVVAGFPILDILSELRTVSVEVRAVRAPDTDSPLLAVSLVVLLLLRRHP